MEVYHGSYLKIDVIDLAKCRANRDFGQGFYVTNIRTQAEYWAKRIGEQKNTKGIVTVFEFNERAWGDEEYNIRRFEAYTEGWLDFVVLNRDSSTMQKRHDYDIVEGPVADDAISVRINDYLNGEISKAVFLDELKFKRPSHQIAFCTLKSLLMLKLVNTKSNSILYHADDNIIQQLMLDYELIDTKASDLYFNSHTYKQLIDETTGIYQKPWTEIYRMLLHELKLNESV